MDGDFLPLRDGCFPEEKGQKRNGHCNDKDNYQIQ